MDAHRHTTLLIDDDDDLREGLDLFLRSQGCAVVATADAPTALTHLRNGLRPCLVLLDVNLPGMNGWQLIEALRSVPIAADTPIAIITGDHRHVLRAQAMG